MTAEPALPPPAPASHPTPQPRRRRPWLIALAVVAAVLLGLWSQRRPIAADLIAQRLADWGVPARYTVADIGLSRQRLTHVVLGDPAHPDLVADWVAVDTGISLSGARIIGIRAGHVRLRGRLVGGVVSLGSLDKLLPAPSGKPFALPAVELSVDDGRMRLETPQGIIGLKLAGAGRLDDGFAGQLAAVSERIDAGGCRAERIAAVLAVKIIAAQPQLDGPVRANTLACPGLRASGVVIDQSTRLGAALDRWQGSARVAIATARHPAVALEAIAGRIGYAGSPTRTAGTLDLLASRLATAPLAAQAVHLAGNYRIGRSAAGFAAGYQGTIGARLAIGPAGAAMLARIGSAAPGTPVAPLLARLADAARRAARDMTVGGDLTIDMAGATGSLGLTRVMMHSGSGAVGTLSGGGVDYRWPGGGARINGLLALSGGDLPDLALRLRAAGDGSIRGNGLLRPYAAGKARLALDAIDLAWQPGGGGQFSAGAALSGPVAGGWIDSARLPIRARWDGGGGLSVNPGCTPLSAVRLTIASLDLPGLRTTICPTGSAMLTLAGGRIGGGVRAQDLALAGTLGRAPLALSAHQARYDIAGAAFDLAGVAVRLGATDRETNADIAHLDGRIAGGMASGRFDGGGGRIGGVPLLLSAAAGDWTWRDGGLTATGALAVADANPAPRFRPVKADHVRLTLADNRITATGTLEHPGSGTLLSNVVLHHDLASGAGDADLAVPGIVFGTGLQPDQLTPLTFGVIAGVHATVSGEGHLRWTADTLASTGVFRTKDASLDAAFGPVAGLSTELHLTDLLNMVSAPDQVATVARINPGVSVENGIVHYALLADQKVAVTSADWPFAGGRLTLAPTVLDFTEHHPRALTLQVTGLDAALFLQQLDFKNLNATGVFDGTLPMIFDESGGRIEQGHLTARHGGGTIAYVGELTQKDLGLWGNMAFQALKALNYRDVTIDMNGPLEGEIITDIRFAGISQGAGTKSNFLIKRLAHLPLVFNVRVKAPFRQLINSAVSLYDPRSLIRQQLLLAPAQPIQPPESEHRP